MFLLPTLENDNNNKKKDEKVSKCVCPGVISQDRCPRPSLRPRLPPLSCTWPPVAALAPRAEYQTTARVRSNSPKKRLAEKPQRCAPANPQGGRGRREPPSPGRPLFSQSVQSGPHTASPRPRSVRARSRSARAQEMRARRDAHKGGNGSIRPGTRGADRLPREILKRALDPDSLRAP